MKKKTVTFESGVGRPCVLRRSEEVSHQLLVRTEALLLRKASDMAPSNPPLRFGVPLSAPRKKDVITPAQLDTASADSFLFGQSSVLKIEPATAILKSSTRAQYSASLQTPQKRSAAELKLEITTPALSPLDKFADWSQDDITLFQRSNAVLTISSQSAVAKAPSPRIVSSSPMSLQGPCRISSALPMFPPEILLASPETTTGDSGKKRMRTIDQKEASLPAEPTGDVFGASPPATHAGSVLTITAAQRERHRTASDKFYQGLGTQKHQSR